MHGKVSAATPKINSWRDLDCSLTLFRIPQAAKVSIDRSFHEDVTLLSFIGCNWKSQCRRQSHIETENNVVLRDSGELFSTNLIKVESQEALCREIHISHNRLSQVYEAIGTRKHLDFTNPNLTNPAAARLIFDLHQASEMKGSALESESILLELILNLLNNQKGSSHIKNPYSDGMRMNRAIDYMNSHYMENITLSDLSREIDINPFVMIRMFKKKIGITPYEYLRSIRINKAKQYMIAGIKFVDIANLCGFADQSHMIRHFKRKTGVTPKAFLTKIPNITI